MKMSLTREQILGVQDRPMKEVAVPDWGEGASVWLRMLSAGERDRVTVMSQKPDGQMDPENFRCKLLVFCLCDEKGNRLFTDEEFVELSEKSAVVITRLFDEAQKLNGLARNEVEQVEEARKNS